MGHKYAHFDIFMYILAILVKIILRIFLFLMYNRLNRINSR